MQGRTVSPGFFFMPFFLSVSVVVVQENIHDAGSDGHSCLHWSQLGEIAMRIVNMPPNGTNSIGATLTEFAEACKMPGCLSRYLFNGNQVQS
jgi:hypothetical protein